MIKNILLITITIILLIGGYFTLNMNEPKKLISEADIKEGTHYKKVDFSKINISDKKTIERLRNEKIVDIFWINCPNCYDKTQLFKNNNIENVYYYPFSFEGESDFVKDAKMVFLVKNFSNDNSDIYNLFDFYKNKKSVSENDVINFLSSSMNIEKNSLKKFLESEELKIKIKDANEVSNKLKIYSVPTVFVNGYEVLGSNIFDDEDYIKVINYLLNK